MNQHPVIKQTNVGCQNEKDLTFWIQKLKFFLCGKCGKLSKFKHPEPTAGIVEKSEQVFKSSFSLS